jgi:iodotyrosine deiodinase
MTKPEFVPYSEFHKYPPEKMKERSKQFLKDIKRRRTVRDFSDRPVPLEAIENCIKAAATAPSGANRQPWHFVVVSNRIIKKQIRIAAEKEEHEFYVHRAPADWLAALAPLGTDEQKPFLEEAPYLIVIFSQSYQMTPDGKKMKNYYVPESVGIATGVLITALHHSGLATLTHTPAPMKFLNKILGRPSNEKPFLILVVGYPAKGTRVPAIKKKGLSKIADFVD